MMFFSSGFFKKKFPWHSLSFIWECEEFPMTTSFKSPWQRRLRSATDCLTLSKTQLSAQAWSLWFCYFNGFNGFKDKNVLLVFIAQIVCIKFQLQCLFLECYFKYWADLFLLPHLESAYSLNNGMQNIGKNVLLGSWSLSIWPISWFFLFHYFTYQHVKVKHRGVICLFVYFSFFAVYPWTY